MKSSWRNASNMIFVTMPLCVIFIQFEKWTFSWEWHFWQQSYLCNVKKSEPVKQKAIFNCIKFSKLKFPVRTKKQFRFHFDLKYFILNVTIAIILQNNFPIFILVYFTKQRFKQFTLFFFLYWFIKCWLWFKFLIFVFYFLTFLFYLEEFIKVFFI